MMNELMQIFGQSDGQQMSFDQVRSADEGQARICPSGIIIHLTAG